MFDSDFVFFFSIFHFPCEFDRTHSAFSEFRYPQPFAWLAWPEPLCIYILGWMCVCVGTYHVLFSKHIFFLASKLYPSLRLLLLGDSSLVLRALVRFLNFIFVTNSFLIVRRLSPFAQKKHPPTDGTYNFWWNQTKSAAGCVLVCVAPFTRCNRTIQSETNEYYADNLPTNLLDCARAIAIECIWTTRKTNKKKHFVTHWLH